MSGTCSADAYDATAEQVDVIPGDAPDGDEELAAAFRHIREAEQLIRDVNQANSAINSDYDDVFIVCTRCNSQLSLTSRPLMKVTMHCKCGTVFSVTGDVR